MIRALEAGDAEALARLFERNNHPEVTRHFHPFALEPSVARELCAEGAPDDYFVSEEGGEIQALGMLRGWKEGYAVPSFGLLVDRAASGKGMGKALTRHAIARAGERGCPSIRLTVNSDNPAAIRVYERAGFEVAETRADGRLVMTRKLP